MQNVNASDSQRVLRPFGSIATVNSVRITPTTRRLWLGALNCPSYGYVNSGAYFLILYYYYSGHITFRAPLFLLTLFSLLPAPPPAATTLLSSSSASNDSTRVPCHDAAPDVLQHTHPLYPRCSHHLSCSLFEYTPHHHSTT